MDRCLIEHSKCPVDQQYIYYSDIYPAYYIRREINNLKIICPKGEDIEDDDKS